MYASIRRASLLKAIVAVMAVAAAAAALLRLFRVRTYAKRPALALALERTVVSSGSRVVRVKVRLIVGRAQCHCRNEKTISDLE